MNAKKARLIINAYPILVLSNKWLEQLFCPKCGHSRRCHVTKHDTFVHTVRWAPRELWEQVAHLDPTAANPTVSKYTLATRGAIRLNGWIASASTTDYSGSAEGLDQFNGIVYSEDSRGIEAPIQGDQDAPMGAPPEQLDSYR